MIYVGIDVASDKHDCCIFDGNGSVLRENFTVENNRDGFNELLEYPTAKQIASCHLTHLTNLLTEHSHGKYGREKALEFRALAEKSIGLDSRSVGFELQQTIRLIQNLQQEILILEKHIKAVMKEINSPILTVPGISYTLGAIILAAARRSPKASITTLL
jgi:transposase